jgi:hypothetical protein
MTTIATTLLLGLAPAAAAVAAPGDVAATHAYIRANYAFTRATKAEVKAAQANVEATIHKLAAECPDVGAGSPQNEESQHISYEVVVALWSASFATDAGPIHTFANAVRRLHWSNPKLTRRAQRYARSLQQLASLQRPEVCADATAWKTSGFKTVPANTIKLDRHVEAIEAKTIPASLLAQYEQPSDKAALASTTHIETQLQETETTVGFNDWDQALESLGLNQ